jgi:hypothetical protein
MPETAATLKDVTSPNPPVLPVEPAKDAVTPAASATTLEVADRDAAELGRTLLDMGVTKDQLNDIMAAPSALNSIRYMVENDPQEFIRSLERTNPGAGENFLDKLSKLYVDRYAKDGTKAADGTTDANADVLREVKELRDQVQGFQTQAQRAASASAMAQVQARYNARVDDLFGQLPAEKFPLSPMERELIKGKLSADLAADPSIVQRVSNGNFVDVPRTFKGIVEGLATDRVKTAETAKAARERSASSAFPDFGAGPVELPKDFYDVSNVPVDKLWDEDAFVSVLTKI